MERPATMGQLYALQTDENYRELLHMPNDLALEHVRWAERLQNCPGVPFGIPTVDRYVVPFHPGDMVTFCARPGHGKTSILAYLARAEAKRIVARGMEDREIVVYVTWEQVTEEINSVFETGNEYTVSDIVWGRVDMKAIERQSTKRAGLPICIIGDSLARSNAQSPRMYPETVFRTIESIERDYNKKPTLMLFDYIQLIPIRHQADRHKQVIEAAHRCKELAKRVGCPAAVAVQARREVDTRTNKMPGLWDAQWSSSIEQTADKFFSLWRPWLTEDRARPVEIDGQSIPITERLLIMSMLKQRFENGRHTWPLHFRPQYLDLCAMETDVSGVYG
jgi:replicative DNA helicase